MDNHLQHHGILGMKWGIRRFQNKDGSLTSAGKRRKNASSMSDEELTSQVKRLSLESTYNKLSKTGPSKMEKTKKAIDATSNLVNQAKSLNHQTSKSYSQKLDLSNMTNQQLRDRINRTNLERQYNDLFGSETRTVSKGQRYASNILAASGATLAVGSSALGIALAIKELRS
ncbi:hypothetical protein FACS1894132_11160 [Clostridia bacterium]|nr:hypothetical protein FACS1894132_11160 [Clostridia bacterium]